VLLQLRLDSAFVVQALSASDTEVLRAGGLFDSAPLEVVVSDVGREPYGFGEFELDVDRACLTKGDQTIALRPRSFDLLRYFVEHPGRLIGRDELMAALWPRVVVTDESLTHCVTDVRQALLDHDRRLVRTVPRRGYLFAAEVLARGSRAPPTVSPVARGDLPPYASQLVGRADDERQAISLLSEHRIVSLVGPGGVGKSALARVVFDGQRAAYVDGVSWVDLAALPGDSEPSVAVSVAGAIGVTIGAIDPLVALQGVLRPLNLLLVLDNAEHLVGAARALVRALVDVAPQLRILVTSQMPLGLPIEQVLRLEPLALPPEGADRETVRCSPAVALFEQRARTADSRFSLERADLALTLELCRRLDGLPLAIELAAARVPWLGLPRLCASLDERFRALDATVARSDSRHLTLTAAMQWSHDLLDDAERLVFRRLAVFAGSFTLDAAQALLADTALDRWDVLQAVGGLAERSLLSVSREETTRYRLLETPRAYALERLREANEEPAQRLRHVHVTCARLEAAYETYLHRIDSVDEWRAALHPELDDARAALAYALDRDAPSAVSLAGCMALVLSSESPSELREMLLATLPLLQGGAAPIACARWYHEAAFAFAEVKPADARAWAANALELTRTLSDRIGQYRALGASVYVDHGAVDASIHPHLAQMQALEDGSWPLAVRAQGAHAAACWYSARGEFELALRWRRRCVDLYARAGHSWRHLAEQANLLDTLLASGRVTEAVSLGTELQTAQAATRFKAALPGARLNFLGALLASGDLQRARMQVEEGWPFAVRANWQAYWADHLALMAALEGRARSAALLVGASDARYEQLDVAREVNEARAWERARAQAERALGLVQSVALREAGASLDDEEIVRVALSRDDANDLI
jgi:predicted ATPase/DNA-binding winged helix-turn-helix (wHTH) protein